jgi:hypothetical protein
LRTEPEILQDAEFNAEDVYQIEFDGASKGNPGQAGAGALIRCPHGSVVGYLSDHLNMYVAPFLNKASIYLF